MTGNRQNHPFVVWGSCFLWVTSIFAITWSLILFATVGDILVVTGTDLVNATVLLAGIIMLPTNVFILHAVANGKKITHVSKVVFCPLWMCIMWILIIDSLGVGLCLHKMCNNKITTTDKLTQTIRYYRSVPKYKHFIDTLQWSLQCCGLNSYKDWFNNEWYDRIRDYEWDPGINKRSIYRKNKVIPLSDSVPLSCCKSGSCISSYLTELGTRSIYTNGCGKRIYRIILYSMIGHILLFLSIIVVEVGILLCILDRSAPPYREKYETQLNVTHIMNVKENFDASSASLPLNFDNSEDEEMEMRR